MLKMGLISAESDFFADLADGLGGDVKILCDVLQVELLHDAWAATEQLVVTLAGCGTVEILITCLELMVIRKHLALLAPDTPKSKWKITCTTCTTCTGNQDLHVYAWRHV